MLLPLSRRFNEAAGIHRRKPPASLAMGTPGRALASMRPPEFTGGNHASGRVLSVAAVDRRFNEAAGIHRRKRRDSGRTLITKARPGRFNEAAGIHRRKLAARTSDGVRPQEKHFNEAAGIHRRKPAAIIAA